MKRRARLSIGKFAKSVRRSRFCAWLLEDGSQPFQISDEFVMWVYYANAGMLNPGNLHCFDYAIGRLSGESAIVEIGSFCGLSTNLLGYYKRRHGKSNRLITCDDWSFAGAVPGPEFPRSEIPFDEYRALVKEAFVRNARLFSRPDLPCTVELPAADFFAAWKRGTRVVDVFGRPVQLGGLIGFCYIDGSHAYESVKQDFENCDAFLESGGFVLFDDSSDDSYFDGVRRVAAEVEHSGKYRLLMKNPNCLFQKNP